MRGLLGLAIGLPLLAVGVGLTANMLYNIHPRTRYVSKPNNQQDEPEEVEVVEVHELHPLERAQHIYGFACMQQYHMVEIMDEGKQGE